MSYKTDIEIARAAQKKPIFEIGEALSIPAADLVPCLPRTPAAETIRINDTGEIEGLF